LLLVG
jgi:hypothetical protein